MSPVVRVRILTSFLGRMSSSMIYPFLAIYYAKYVGVQIAGAFLMMHVATSFGASLFGGHLADTWGRKRVLLAGDSVKVLAFLGIVMANAPWGRWEGSVWITFVLLLAVSVAGGLSAPAAEAILIDASTPESRKSMYAINYWATNLSIMLGATIGAWLFADNFLLLLTGLFLMSLVTFLMDKYLIQDEFRPKIEVIAGESKLRQLIASYRSASRNAPFMWFTAAGVSILIVEFQRNDYLSIRLAQDLAIQNLTFWNGRSIELNGVKLFGFITFVNTFLIVLLGIPFSHLIRNVPVKLAMYIGFLLFGLGYALLAYASAPLILVAAAVILTIGELLYEPTRQAAMADFIDDERRGIYLAVNGMVFQAARWFSAGLVIFSPWLGNIGLGVTYLLLAFLAVFLSSVAFHRRLTRVAHTLTEG
ncbi:MDR family MFS transporter [Deinococcus multiflagellatus]|uniref:MDR family MFS transporter n=2 Tax=Deinococcus multiflagellatus TaxID=1656887 RepID=A0ABW1ZTQ2_9DEIO|nr:MFS transporter [Deinococcus multiflagellatus]